MRVLNYPYDTNKVQLRDYYDNVRGEFTINKGENTLPITEQLNKLVDTFNNVFFIHNGSGELTFEWAKKELDFTKLEYLYLEYYLRNQAFLEDTNAYQKRKILEFIEVYNENIAHNGYYLEPFGFKALDSMLLKGQQWHD